MEPSIKWSALKLKKPERKVTEKIRRNQMKSLNSHLFSLIPPNIISQSKDGDRVSDRVDTAIDYIQSLKANLELRKKEKDKLLSTKRSHEDTTINVCKSLNIQIYEMGHDLDVILVTGLTNYSSFCYVVQLLDKYSTEVALANFSSCGHSTFHIHHKKIEAEDICMRVKMFVEGSITYELGDTNASVGDHTDTKLSVCDFDFQHNMGTAGRTLVRDVPNEYLRIMM